MISLQDNTFVPATPLFSAKILKEDEDMWLDVQVCYGVPYTLFFSSHILFTKLSAM